MILWTNFIRRKFVDASKTFSDWLMLSCVKVIALEHHLVFIMLENIFYNPKSITFWIFISFEEENFSSHSPKSIFLMSGRRRFERRYPDNEFFANHEKL